MYSIERREFNTDTECARVRIDDESIAAMFPVIERPGIRESPSERRWTPLPFECEFDRSSRRRRSGDSDARFEWSQGREASLRRRIEAHREKIRKEAGTTVGDVPTESLLEI